MTARALTATERSVLELLLAEDFSGAEALRAQVASVQVIGGCDCGCPTINLAVAGDVPLAVVESRTPVNAHVDGVVGGGLIVFVDDGRLSSLEYYSSEDTPPADFPALDRIRPYV
jgi:hypothetical protein